MDQIIARVMSHLQFAFSQEPFDARLCKYLIFTLMTVMEGQLARTLTVDVVTVCFLDFNVSFQSCDINFHFENDTSTDSNHH